jgi:hypothetical protein
VVSDPPHAVRVQAWQAGLEEERRAARVERAQALPVVLGDVGAGLGGEPGVVGVRDGVEVCGREAARGQAEPHGLLGQLPGRERHRRLAVLAPREALLFRRRHRPTVDDEGRGGVVEDRVDAEDLHQRRGLSEKRFSSNEAVPGGVTDVTAIPKPAWLRSNSRVRSPSGPAERVSRSVRRPCGGARAPAG